MTGVTGVTGSTGATGVSANYLSVTQTTSSGNNLAVANNANLLASGTLNVNQTVLGTFSGGTFTFTNGGTFLILYGFSPANGGNSSCALRLSGNTITGSINHGSEGQQTLISNALLLTVGAGDTLEIFNNTGSSIQIGTQNPAGQQATVAYLTIVQVS